MGIMIFRKVVMELNAKIGKYERLLCRDRLDFSMRLPLEGVIAKSGNEDDVYYRPLHYPLHGNYVSGVGDPVEGHP